MKVVTLIEDTKENDNLVSEFGLSLYIETNGQKILLDTGSSGNFQKNGSVLGVDLQAVDFVIISHAHTDHGGGLNSFFQINKRAAVYMHAASVNEYYGNIGARLPLVMNYFVHPLVGRSMAFSRSIGLDQGVLRQYENRIKFISKTEEVSQNVFLITNIRKKHTQPEGNKFLLMQKNGRLEPDDFKHEIILAIKESDGVVLFTGCCHNGILNVLETVNEVFNNLPIKSVIGGFHLKLQPGKDNLAGTQNDICLIADQITKYKIKKIYTGHCTGSKAYNILKERLKDRIERLYTGRTIHL